MSCVLLIVVRLWQTLYLDERLSSERMKSVALGTMLAVGAFIFSPPAFALPCPPAKTPNSDLASADRVTGEFCRSGHTSGEVRSLVRVDLSAADAERMWSFALDVLPGQSGKLEVFEIQTGTDPQDLKAVPLRFAMTTSPQTIRAETPPLVLRPGSYVLAMSGNDTSYRVRGAPGAQRPSAIAGEQLHDDFASGTVTTDHAIEWPWEISAAGAHFRWNLTLQSPPGAPVRFSVKGQAFSALSAQVGNAFGVEQLADLGLAAGNYTIGIDPGNVPILLSASHSEAERTADFSEEPNDLTTSAHALSIGAPASGRLVPTIYAEDTDYFSLVIDDAVAKSESDLVFRCDSDAPVTLDLLSESGQLLVSKKGSREFRVTGLALRAGRYFIKLSGNLPLSATYLLTVQSGSDVAAGSEEEPNNAPEFAMTVSAGETLRGTLSADDTRDYVNIDVGGALELWNVDVIGPGAKQLTLLDSRRYKVAEAVARPGAGAGALGFARILLPQGPNRFYLEGDSGSWLLKATRLGPPKPGDEIEPNDDVTHALVAPLNTDMRGYLDHGQDVDYYTFHLAAETAIGISVAAPAEFPVYLAAQWGERGDRVVTFTTTEAPDKLHRGQWRGNLPPGDYYVSLAGPYGDFRKDPYTLRVDGESFFSGNEGGAAANGIAASIVLASAEVAAYSPLGQRVQGTLEVNPTSGSSLVVRARVWIGDERWGVVGLPETLTLTAGQPNRFPFTLNVAPDARDDVEVPIEIGLFSAQNAHLVSAFGALNPKSTVRPVDPIPESALPASMLGGLNVAWTALGGKTAPEYGRLIDGVIDGGAVSLPIGKPITVELGNGKPFRLAGITLTPPPVSSPQQRLKKFSVAVSTDGAQYTPVLDGQLSPLVREQGFAFASAPSAAYVRLTAVSDYKDHDSGEALVSELRVVADPNAEQGGFSGFDLGLPELGGHYVWADPQPDHAVSGSGAYPFQTPVLFHLDQPTKPQWAIGFRNNRIAQITELTWKDRAGVAPKDQIAKVTVSASTISALGPWTALGDWDLQKKEQGLSRLSFATPVSARALKFQVAAASAGTLALPEKIAVIERAPSRNYRSILGVWGDEIDSAATREVAKTEGAKGPAVPVRHSRADAAELAADTIASGIVEMGRSENWYKATLRAPAYGMNITVGGNPGPEVKVELSDETGKVLPLVSDDQAMGAFAAPLGPGTYYLRVSQPRRSLLVAWDTSRSVAGFEAGIRRVVERLSWDLQSGEEEINLLPFRGDQSKPLLEHWAAGPGEVYSALAAYSWNDWSSNAEAALLAAGKAFETRDGIRAVAIITDGASDGGMLGSQVWQRLGTQQLRIFSLQIPTDDPAETTRATQNLLRDWSAAGDGHFGIFSSQGEADQLFRRMAAQLREPAAYALSYAVIQSPPQPGTLIVKRGPASGETGPGAGESVSTSAPAVALLIDASGSMLQKLHGMTKIDMEKKLLSALVEQSLASDTQLVIRVFGQGGEGSCRSDLVHPLSSLDAPKALQIISKIRATNGAKTAIADSLKALAQDLARAPRKRLIVLITDGEETCGGDPRHEIDALRAQGFDIRVNIVGFAVDSPETQKSFQEWATAGGGKYFDAVDEVTLKQAIQKALVSELGIFDGDGKLVARTTVGAVPLTLPAGRYSLRPVDSAENQATEFQVRSGKLTTLLLAP